MDTIVQFRNNVKGDDWEGGLSSYSVHTIGRFLSEKEYNYEFRRFKLEMDLQESDDPIRTYTITTSDGDRMVVNGANIIAEHYFLVIQG